MSGWTVAIFLAAVLAWVLTSPSVRQMPVHHNPAYDATCRHA